MHRFFKYIIAQKKAKYINIRSVLLLNAQYLCTTKTYSQFIKAVPVHKSFED